MPHSPKTDSPLQVFERHRGRLRGLAYRLTGSIAETDDILQEAYLRWTRAASGVTTPRAYLTKLVTHLCLDGMKSARARRESYVGAWLPEPVLDTPPMTPDATTELAQDVTFALLLAMERLTPLERAAFILHDVFDVDYGDLAETLGRSETTCRKLAARGRDHVRREAARTERPSDEEQQRLVGAFFGAVRTGDAAELSKLLTERVVFCSDGGGQVKAATKPVRGIERVTRFLLGIASKYPETYQHAKIVPTRINGMPGALFWQDDELVRTFAFDFDGQHIAAVYVVANPNKLGHLRASATN